MAEPISFGKLEFNLVSSMEGTRGVQDADTPFHILLSGDFSGRKTRGMDPSGNGLKALRPILVDRDTIDTVMEKLHVEIHLPILGESSPPVCISFSELDDFHPDALYHRLDVFQALKDTKKEPQRPGTV